MNFRDYLISRIKEKKKKDNIFLIISPVLCVLSVLIAFFCLIIDENDSFRWFAFGGCLIFAVGWAVCFVLYLVRKIKSAESIVSEFDRNLAAFGNVGMLYNTLAAMQPLQGTRDMEIRMNYVFCFVTFKGNPEFLYFFPTSSILRCETAVVMDNPFLKLICMINGKEKTLCDPIDSVAAANVIQQIRQYRPDL